MKVIDTSGWLEILSDGPRADEILTHLEKMADVITPVIVIYEVYRWVKRVRGEEQALRAVAVLEQTQIIQLTPALAMEAADWGLGHRLAMADSIVFATATAAGAQLITCDEDFKGLPNVVFYSKK